MRDIRTASGSSALQAELNITPLIDVMLVLLIIFMVALPAMTRVLPLRLPSGSPPEETMIRPQPARLSIEAGGQVVLDGHRLEEKQLDYALRTLARQVPQPVIRIDVVDSVRYQRVASLMSRVRSAGLTQISMKTSD